MNQRLFLLLLTLFIAGNRVPLGDDWKYDVVYRKRGKPYRGLVVADTPEQVEIRGVLRRTGRPTVVIRESLPRAEVDRVELLSDNERDKLRRRLDSLAKEREAFNARLRALDIGKEIPASDDGFELKSVPWPGEGHDKSNAVAYESTYFKLVSTSRADIVRLVAMQLESVYTAYAHALPPQLGDADPTTILLVASMAEYQTLVRARGQNILNPAFFDAPRHQVVCACELERLLDEMAGVRKQHDKQRVAIKATEADLRKAYKDRVPAELLRGLDDDRRRMAQTEERNLAAFENSRSRLFRRLYHEAFHAYLATYVYPPGHSEPPRWLNEGLAQIFESAIVEVGELRVGHVDREHYDALRSALKKGDLLPLADLLKSGPRQFVVAHAAEQQSSDRYYLAAWALSFHLAFERRLLGTPALDAYLRNEAQGADPIAEFEILTGMPLARFEGEFRDYLTRLRLDGSAPK